MEIPSQRMMQVSSALETETFTIEAPGTYSLPLAWRLAPEAFGKEDHNISI